MYISPLPLLGTLRVAAPPDVLRIGVVATAGFRYAEQFLWERPRHEQYPNDTILFFRHEFADFMKSPEHIVLVAFDKYEADESNKTAAVIPPDNGFTPPETGEEVIVAVGCWKLEPGSKRKGRFQNKMGGYLVPIWQAQKFSETSSNLAKISTYSPTGSYPALPDNQNRDLSKDHVKRVTRIAEAAEEKYLEGLSSMERLVTHPAYWGRGHGGNLTKWGTDLADLDHVDQGVLASSMGAGLYLQYGFKNLTDVHVEGDEEMPEGLALAVMKYHFNESGKPISEL